MLSNAEVDKVRSQLSRIRARIGELEEEIKRANHKIAQVQDEIGEEKDIRSSKAENQAFYSAVSRSIAKLEWELSRHYEVRTELIARLKAFRELRNTLHSELENG